MRKVQLIIRMAGERTADWCYQYHHRLFPEYPCMPFGDPSLSSHDNILNLIHCMSETPGPFLLIDADIFITNPEHLVGLLETEVDKRHHIKSMLTCRFMGPVYRGVLLFSEKFCRKMKEIVLTSKITEHPSFILRPFRAIIEETFAALQLNPNQDADSEVVGIHDFFQYRQHIYHKMINRAWRLSSGESALLEEKLKNSTSVDDQIAWSGLIRGRELKPLKIGYQQVLDDFLKMQIEEKSPTLEKSELSDFPRKGLFLKGRQFDIFEEVTSAQED
jgi:hypothetical protein